MRVGYRCKFLTFTLVARGNVYMVAGIAWVG